MSNLKRPDGTDPDGFYRSVAEEYALLSALFTNPGKILAADVGVPVTTVHRWVREARTRGFLPKGRQGTARQLTAWESVAQDLGVEVDDLKRAVAEHAPGGLRHTSEALEALRAQNVEA